MKWGADTSTNRIILVSAVAGGVLAAAAFYYYAWRSDVRQLVRETEEFLAEQPLPSR